jgi:phage shock protein A
MSETETEEVVVEEVEGVTVTKYFDEDEFHFPSMVLEFDSHRNEEVDIRVEEEKPAGISIENIGFHPAHGADYWSIEDNTLVFEDRLDSNSEYRTVYALRTKGPDEARKMFSEPDVIDVSPPLPETGEVEPATPMTRSSNDSPYREGEEQTESDLAEEIPAEQEIAESEPTEPDSTASEMETEVEESDEEADEGVGTGSVVEQLARELREERAPEDSLAFIEEEFGTATDSSGSLEARLTQVQEDVANLRSYTNALEDFLDEEGSAQEIVDEFESRLEGFEADVDRIEASTGALNEELQTLQDDLSEFDDSLDSLSSNYAELADEVSGLRADIAETEDRLPEYDIDEQFTEIEDELSELNGFVKSLKSAFD